MRDGYISVDEISEELGINKATVWRWLKRDGVTAVKFRGDRRAYITSEQADLFRQPITDTKNRHPDESE